MEDPETAFPPAGGVPPRPPTPATFPEGVFVMVMDDPKEGPTSGLGLPPLAGSDRPVGVAVQDNP